MNKDIMTQLAKTLESLSNRISAIESDYVYGKVLIETALQNGKKRSSKSKQTKQSDRRA